MKNIDQIQKLAILHCVYQVIASADGNIDDERDAPAIQMALHELDLNAIFYWNTALQQNPHDCFIHLYSLAENNRIILGALLHNIAEMGGNTLFRINCANHILELCKPPYSSK